MVIVVVAAHALNSVEIEARTITPVRGEILERVLHVAGESVRLRVLAIIPGRAADRSRLHVLSFPSRVPVRCDHLTRLRATRPQGLPGGAGRRNRRFRSVRRTARRICPAWRCLRFSPSARDVGGVLCAASTGPPRRRSSTRLRRPLKTWQSRRADPRLGKPQANDRREETPRAPDGSRRRQQVQQSLVSSLRAELTAPFRRSGWPEDPQVQRQTLPRRSKLDHICRYDVD
jgi:hypothetical protein